MGMKPSATAPLLRAADLAVPPSDGDLRRELEEGVLIEMCPVKPPHSLTTVRLAAGLEGWRALRGGQGSPLRPGGPA